MADCEQIYSTEVHRAKPNMDNVLPGILLWQYTGQYGLILCNCGL